VIYPIHNRQVAHPGWILLVHKERHTDGNFPVNCGRHTLLHTKREMHILYITVDILYLIFVHISTYILSTLSPTDGNIKHPSLPAIKCPPLLTLFHNYRSALIHNTTTAVPHIATTDTLSDTLSVSILSTLDSGYVNKRYGYYNNTYPKQTQIILTLTNISNKNDDPITVNYNSSKRH